MLYTDLIKPLGGEDFDERIEYPLAIYWSLKLATHTEFKIQTCQRELAACVATLSGTKVVEKEEGETRELRIAARAALLDFTKREKATHLPSQVIELNLYKLETLLSLTQVEKKVLLIGAIAQNSTLLQTTLSDLDVASTSRAAALLATLIDAKPNEVEHALGVDSALNRMFLLENAPDGIDKKSKLIDFVELAKAINLQLDKDGADFKALFSDSCDVVDCSNESLASHTHLQPVLGDISAVLERALGDEVRGVNVLIYGPPGSGKTSLARAVSDSLSANLFSVSCRDTNGNPATPKGRKAAFVRGLRLLTHSDRAMLLFDEIEDVFPDRFWRRYSDSAELDKAWWVELLESNSVPTIWISNEIDQIDPALIRRFSAVLEVDIPANKVLSNIVSKHVEGLSVSEAWIENVSRHKHLAPGHIASAAASVKRLQLPRSQHEAFLTRLLENSQRALQTPMSGRGLLSVVPYNPKFINCYRDVEEIAAGIDKCRSARILMYGEPGTGKTAWARSLADSLGVELHVKKGSDILGMYVGQTEKAIAKAFSKAKDKGALLLFDEVDSFLHNRDGVSQQWQVKQVNEFLTQLEEFDGLVACTTNRMDFLDQASLRRFDFKLRFDYMRVDQIRGMIDAILVKFEMEHLVFDRASEIRLHELRKVTAGDFQIALRRLSFREDQWTIPDLLDELQSEVDAKQSDGFSNPIGFQR